MRCLVLFLLLLATVAPAAHAQKVIEKTAPVAAGQRVFLNLKQGSTIRIRAGAAGQLRLKATVTINQNKANEALLLTVTPGSEELRVESAFDEEMLRNAPPGDCSEAQGVYYGDTYMGSKYDPKTREGRSKRAGYHVCADIVYDITLPANVVLRVNTLGANIDIAGLTGPIEAKSLSGFVDVSWPPTAGAELALKTITGEVYTDQDVTFSSEPRSRNSGVGYQLRGTLRGSGPLVKLESISNDVYFRKRK